MILIGYHGTNIEIEVFDLDHLGSGQGQSRFPGIYFSENFGVAKEYSNLAVDKNGGQPRVYVAECLLEKPLDIRKGTKLFNSFGETLAFLKEYFPNWFDENGNLLPYKEDYVTSKYETYDGQYNLIKYASEANDIPLIEVCLGLGFDSWVCDSGFVITSPQQILSFMEVDHQLSPDEINQERLPADESLYTPEMASAFETTSNQYIQASKKGRPYKTKPGNRFLRRVYIKMNGGNNVWFDIDMNRLFRKGSFAVKIPVVGETKEYIDTISFEDWLPKLRDDIARTGFTQLTVKRSLMEMLRFHDLKVHCTCPDYCLTGDMKISLLDGRDLTIPEIIDEIRSGKEIWVYSSDERGDFKPGLVEDAFESRKVKSLIQVTLDTGEVITCTPDHPFMLRDGRYIKAEDLVVGQSLMPMYFGQNKKGYRTVKLNSRETTSFYSVYKLVAENLMPEKIDEAKSRLTEEDQKFMYDVAIHHRNFNKSDNSPNNLEIMTPAEHFKLHGELYSKGDRFDRFIEAGKEYWKSKESREKQSEVAKRVLVPYLKNLSKEEFNELTKNAHTKETVEKISKAHKRLWENMDEDEYRRRCEINKKSNQIARGKIKKALEENWRGLSDEERERRINIVRENAKKGQAAMRGVPKSEEHRRKISEARKAGAKYKWIQLVLDYLKEKNITVTEETYNQARKTLLAIDSNKARWRKRFSSWEEFCKRFNLENHNHSVKDIVKVVLEDEVPVYDISVKRWNNFRLSCGVMVHNCYRMKYWNTVSGDEEGDPETRPANKTNPRNDLGKLCKHLNFCMNNKVWGDKESRIIYNYMINLKRTQRRLFDKLIAPKLGLETQEEEQARLEAERLEREKPNQVNDQVEQELEDQVQKEQPVKQTKEPREGQEGNQ